MVQMPVVGAVTARLLGLDATRPIGAADVDGLPNRHAAAGIQLGASGCSALFFISSPDPFWSGRRVCVGDESARCGAPHGNVAVPVDARIPPRSLAVTPICRTAVAPPVVSRGRR